MMKMKTFTAQEKIIKKKIIPLNLEVAQDLIHKFQQTACSCQSCQNDLELRGKR